MRHVWIRKKYSLHSFLEKFCTNITSYVKKRTRDDNVAMDPSATNHEGVNRIGLYKIKQVSGFCCDGNEH
jgi:hypothetical protein